MNDHRTRADETEGLERHPWQDRCIRPNRRAATDSRRAELRTTTDHRARVGNVGKDGARPDEDVRFEHHAVV